MNRGRGGIAFIEILLATVILAAVIIPIATFIMGGLRRTESSKHYNTALTLASGLMDTLVSTQVPFSAIDPEGGAGLIKALPSINGRSQAGFTGPDAARYEALLANRQADVEGGSAKTRIKDSPDNIPFEVFFFAGLYADDGGPPDIDKELTFTYLPNPFVPPDQDAAQQKVLDVPDTKLNGDGSLFPYNRIPGPPGVDPNSPSFQPGWPRPPTGYSPDPVQLFQDIRAGFANQNDPNYHPIFKDQKQLRGQSGGGFMKLVLGLRWNPNLHIRKGVGYTRQSRELWLVSFKADLE